MSKVKSIIQHPYFWLLLVVLLAYWPITFQQIVVPHDMVNCWIPWRHYISDTIQNGHFPWWNPYQQMGYPIHADLQGPSWHLESLLASLVGRQGPIYIQYILLAYIYIGGLGIYKLGKLMTDQKWILFLAAVAYVCSGFFTNHSMHLFSIISAAFVPHIIYHFIRFSQSAHWSHALLAAVFVFFNLTGGNQTFTIFLFYFLLPILIWNFIQSRKKEHAVKKKLIVNLGIFGTAVISLGLVIFVVFYQFQPYLSRLSDMNVTDASIFPFTFEACLSFINPMAPIAEHEWMRTDGTMSNGYFGLTFLILFISAFFRKKSRFEIHLLVAGLLALLASFGTQTYFYQFLFDYVPMLNKFRFPAYYNYFAMLAALLIGLRSLELIFYGNEDRKKYFLWTGISIGAVIVTTVIVGLIHLPASTFFNSSTSFFDTFLNTSLSQNLFFYGLLQFFILCLIIWAIWFKQKTWLIAVVLIDGIISVQPQVINLGAGSVSPAMIENSLTDYNEDHTPHFNQVKDNLFSTRTIPYLWQNVNHLDKRIGYDGFNSNYFTSLWNLVTKEKAYGDILFSNSFVYLSDEVISQSAFQSDSTLATVNTTVVEDEDLKAFENIHPNNDSLSYIETTQFVNDDMRFLVKNNKVYALNLLQSYYPGWIVLLDGKEVPLYKTNHMFMSVIVPEGEHDVVFKYENKPVKITAFISYGSFLLIMLILTVFYIRKEPSLTGGILSAWILVAAIVIRYFIMT